MSLSLRFGSGGRLGGWRVAVATAVAVAVADGLAV